MKDSRPILPQHRKLLDEAKRDMHLHRSVWCDACKWAGETGQLIAGAKVGLRCPKCDSPEIQYLKAESPARAQ